MKSFRKPLLAALLMLPAFAFAGNGDNNNNGATRLVWDDFQNGFTADSPTAKWFHFGAGSFIGNDGIVTTDHQGLHVRAAGTNPTTGEPAFTLSVPLESQGDGLPGGLDHVKWLVYMNHLASTGYPGFDAVPGRTIACEGWIRGAQYGVENNPFGTLVEDPNSDLRLASFAMNSCDFDSFMVFDFFATNNTIYAFYERLPFGRDRLGNYAAFSHQIPVAHRTPNQQNHLKIEYDRSHGTVQWFVDGVEVFKVDKIGYRLPRSANYITLDHGGVEELVEPKQIDCGMGLFTLLDGYRPNELGLVKLSEQTPYFDPSVGEPTVASFWDDYSAQSSRLFGQGASMDMLKTVVSSRPSTEE